jgi:hypothetical protein
VAKKCTFLIFWNPEIFFLKRPHYGEFYTGNRLRAFPYPENAFMILIQGKNWVFEEIKKEKHDHFRFKNNFS